MNLDKRHELLKWPISILFYVFPHDLKNGQTSFKMVTNRSNIFIVKSINTNWTLTLPIKSKADMTHERQIVLIEHHLKYNQYSMCYSLSVMFS